MSPKPAPWRPWRPQPELGARARARKEAREPKPDPDPELVRGLADPGPSHRFLWLTLAAVTFALHAYALTEYGWFRDELYYVVCARRLAWGYVDHPPLSIALLAAVRAVAGESLGAMRVAAALAASASVFLTARLAARLGGMRFAQTIAGLAAMLAPILLGVGGFYSMNVLDLLFWTICASLLAELIREPRSSRWIALGVTVGLGMLNKLSMSWFAFGLLPALFLSARGRRTLRPAAIAAAGLALLIFLPHVMWQIQHGWPTLEFMRNATARKMLRVAPPDFLREQARGMGFANVLVWLPGLIFPLLAPRARGWRVFSILFLAVAALLIAAGTSRASYLAVAYPPLFALGGLAWERWTAGRVRWVREPLLGLVVVAALPLIPFALPILPVETFIRYQDAIGAKPSTEERKRVGPLPQHYADMFGWPELVGAVEKAAGRLTPEERRGAVVFGQNYGEAAAVDVLGAKAGLPRAVSGHNNYGLWGPGGWDGKVMIIIGGRAEDNASFFDSVERVGVWDHPYAMPYERGLDISIGRGFHGDPAQVWPRLRHFQ